ncbi:hypothetical protein Ddye_003223 [Dipteronia dyeriana]|uniref:Uncharacterized protein n=1 Tax=Dipteronia dyeriana TaxID=168575 RepID=A0AAD9XRV8_9ROSI|nr:hypothetical protein Ddye_003223 [Dipteronia dyeriana]
MAPEQFKLVIVSVVTVHQFHPDQKSINQFGTLLPGQKINDLVCNCATKSVNSEFIFETENETKDEDLESCSSDQTNVKFIKWIFWNKIIGENSFIELVHPTIVGARLCPETLHQMKVFTELAVKCQSKSGDDRPTMIDVAKRLRQLYRSV